MRQHRGETGLGPHWMPFLMIPTKVEPAEPSPVHSGNEAIHVGMPSISLCPHQEIPIGVLTLISHVTSIAKSPSSSLILLSSLRNVIYFAPHLAPVNGEVYFKPSRPANSNAWLAGLV